MASSSDRTITTPTTTSFSNYPYPTEFNVLDCIPKGLIEKSYDKWSKLMTDLIRSQGLIDFIDGNICMVTAPANSVIQESGMSAWKRLDNLVRGWLLITLTEDIRLKMLEQKTAQGVWVALKQMFDLNPYTTFEQLAEEKKQWIADCLPLYIAVSNEDWETVNYEFILREREVVRTPITPLLETLLMLTVRLPMSADSEKFLRKLLVTMSLEDVCAIDCRGMTALHAAAEAGNGEGAEMLVEKYSGLTNILDNNGDTPLNCAAASGNKEIVRYLIASTRDDIILGEERGAKLIRDLARSEFYDIALDLLLCKPELAFMEPTIFYTIAGKHSSFLSGTSLNFYQKFIYSAFPIKSGGPVYWDIENHTNYCISVRQTIHSMFRDVAEKFVPQIKSIREKKRLHHDALELLKFLCATVAESTNISQVEKIFKPAMYKSAKFGTSEIVKEILTAYPLAHEFKNADGQNIFQYAIVWRREQVFNLIYEMNHPSRYIRMQDTLENNGLHLAGRLGHEQQINLRASVAGAVLQMQREFQWFKEVQKFSLPRNKDERNISEMTPAEVFTETHGDLIKEGEQWMKSTVGSCNGVALTIVASLVATMIFAATISVPGGNDNNGQPFFFKQKAFILFAVSNAVAMFSSVTSMLIFLYISTSRYSEADFKQSLPQMLVAGLVTLFVSILSMMVNFGAILYLVFGESKVWMLIPVTALTSIPITFQFPLLIQMIRSTYGPGIFGKQCDHMLD